MPDIQTKREKTGYQESGRARTLNPPPHTLKSALFECKQFSQAKLEIHLRFAHVCIDMRSMYLFLQIGEKARVAESRMQRIVLACMGE